MFGKGPHVCPQCGERVSAFAAGCAICGAELDPHRADRGRRVNTRLNTRGAADQVRTGLRRLFGRASRVSR